MIQFAIFEAVLVLLCLWFSQNVSQSVTEIHCEDFTDLAEPTSYLCLCLLYYRLQRTVRYCFIKSDVLPSQPTYIPDMQACVTPRLPKSKRTILQGRNGTSDLALVSGIEEAKILEIKQSEIHDKVSLSEKMVGFQTCSEVSQERQRNVYKPLSVKRICRPSQSLIWIWTSSAQCRTLC